jgi:hypothetical protein
MLKLSMQTFYQPLFSHSFPFNNFPFSNSFLFQNLPTPKSPKQKAKTKAQKTSKVKVEGKKPKPKPSFKGPFINSSKQGGAAAFGEGRGIVTGETCVPVSLNTSLGDVAVLLFSASWPGLCLSQPTGKNN